MDEFSLVSTGLYRHVNSIVGSEDVVRMRRMVMDLEHDNNSVVLQVFPVCESICLSGSEAEGLRFSTSDRDTMYIFKWVSVIFSFSQLPPVTNTCSTTLLMAECEDTRPGFALLKLVTDSLHPAVRDSCVRLGNHWYVASTLWRNLFLNCERLDVTDTMHGPCASFSVANREVDKAYCVRSDSWPDAALGCIGRLQRAGWPSTDVVLKIVQDGCLFVPIGSRDSYFEEYEWRLSFSLAEKILIHNMTHCQFLTYGLLKIFLKEAIDENQQVQGLLCSYFLKTILFWEITQKRARWIESEFLRNFWKCFQKLVIFVSSGYCPNFFIPENNMFKGKIKGTAQRKLLSHLLTLYRDGYQCLLRCESVRHVMFHVFHQPMLAMRLPSEQEKSVLDLHLIFEIFIRQMNFGDSLQICLRSILWYEFLLSHCSSPLASFVLRTWMKIFLLHVCAVIRNRFSRTVSSNKVQYCTKQTILKTSFMSSCDTVLHFLHLATCLYHFGDLEAAIRILRIVKRRLQHPCLMYSWNLNADKYRAAGGDTTPINNMMDTVVAFPIYFNSTTCIPGLELEHEVARQHLSESIPMPPLVFANVLLFLCYDQEQRIEEANIVLEELSMVVRFDEEEHIPGYCKAISWQLLGICQEMSGDYREAYISYRSAMQQPWCNIRRASELRIRNISANMSRKNV